MLYCCMQLLCFRYCVNEKGERITIIGIILSVLKVLLAENQPYRDFNVAQLRDIDALDKILFMCKVRVKPSQSIITTTSFTVVPPSLMLLSLLHPLLYRASLIENLELEYTL